MASSSSNPNNKKKNILSSSVGMMNVVGFEPNSPTNCNNNNTTFVQADPSNFRAVVQKLTGASPDPSAQKFPVTVPARSSAAKPATTAEMGPKRLPFKLQERRQISSGRKLEIKLNNNNNGPLSLSGPGSSYSAFSPRQRMMMMMNNNGNNNNYIYGGDRDQIQMQVQLQVQQQMMVSPVSPLDLMMLTRGSSPRTSMEELEEEEEERAIADKGFYLHPSPLTTPRATEPPELLPLFPLHSPTHHHNS